MAPSDHDLIINLITYKRKTQILLRWSRKRGQCPPPMLREGALALLQTLEGYNIIIVMPLITKAVIQVHKDLLHKYHL